LVNEETLVELVTIVYCNWDKSLDNQASSLSRFITPIGLHTQNRAVVISISS